MATGTLYGRYCTRYDRSTYSGWVRCGYVTNDCTYNTVLFKVENHIFYKLK